jgi:PAS domain-containing protein
MSSTLPLELTTLLAFWLCLSVWQRNLQPAARRLFIALTLACIAWCVGDICYRSGLLSPMDANRISFLGMTAFAPLWFTLAAHAAGTRITRRAPWLPLALMAPCAAAYALLFIEPWAHLYFSFDADGNVVSGPVLWIAAFCSWTIGGLGCALFVAAAVRLQGTGQWPRRIGVVIAGLLPVVSDISVLAFDLPWTSDPTPIALAGALLILHRAMFTGGLLDVLPISQLDLVTHLPVPVLIADRHGTVIDANPPAHARLGLTVHRILSRPIDEVLADTADHPETEIWPIVANGREHAQIVLLDPQSKSIPRRERSRDS